MIIKNDTIFLQGGLHFYFGKKGVEVLTRSRASILLISWQLFEYGERHRFYKFLPILFFKKGHFCSQNENE